MEWLIVAGGILGGVAAIYTAARLPAVERLRAELEKEHSRFGLLYQRQLEAMSELYGHLGAVEAAAQQLIKPMRWQGEESEEESAQRFVAEYDELRSYFIRNRLFVPRDAADDTERLVTRIGRTVSNFHWMRSHEERGVRGRWPDWPELWDEIKDEVPEVRRELESRFREYLEPSEPVSWRRRVAKWLQ